MGFSIQRWQFRFSFIGISYKIIDFAKKSKFQTFSPTFFDTAKKLQIGSFTNKQTIFFKSLTSKSFLPLCMFMDGDMKKNYYPKHWKNSISCFSLKSSFFRYVILKRLLISQIWPPGHLGWLIWLELNQIIDISSKNMMSKKVYHKSVKQPGH